MTAARALRSMLYAGGAVATAAGLHSMLAGARSIPGRPVAGPEVDSEIRYYGAFYCAFGLAALRVAPSAERRPAAVRTLAGVVLAGGLARAGGWAASGRPHPGQVALLGVELTAPAAVLAAQSRL